MSLERRYSKAIAIGNKITFTDREIIPLTSRLEGLVYDEAEFGLFKVGGRDMFLGGYRIDINLPAASSRVRMSTSLYTGEDELVIGSTLRLDGVTAGKEKTLTPDLAMVSGSTWKMVLTVSGPEDDEFPQGLALTYLLRYASGPVVASYRSGRFTQEGIGFDLIP